jgi:hypothetical protein
MCLQVPGLLEFEGEKVFLLDDSGKLSITMGELSAVLAQVAYQDATDGDAATAALIAAVKRSLEKVDDAALSSVAEQLDLEEGNVSDLGVLQPVQLAALLGVLVAEHGLYPEINPESRLVGCADDSVKDRARSNPLQLQELASSIFEARAQVLSDAADLLSERQHGSGIVTVAMCKQLLQQIAASTAQAPHLPPGGSSSSSSGCATAAQAAAAHALHNVSCKPQPKGHKLQKGPGWQEACKGAGCTIADTAAALRVFAWILRVRMRAQGALPLEAAVGSQLLLLMGKAGTRTQGHVDPAGAVTWAFGLGGEADEQLVLANWLFVHPRVFKEPVLLCTLLGALVEAGAPTLSKPKGGAAALTLLRGPAGAGLTQGERKQLAGMLSSLLEGCVKLTTEQMHTVKAVCRRQAAAAEEPFVWLIPQTAGTAVRVPPGYLHWVDNVADCFKVATEVLCAESAPRCVAMQQQLRMHFKHNQRSYLAAGHQAAKALIAHAQRMPKA